ncbi:MAG: 16S rRNA (cytosine(1402)-N(4))-methyltransferase RsmH [Candidatus Zixiibacteriota bacterium]
MIAREADPYHEPVLADTVVGLLITDPDGAYLDLTAGGGGHLKALAAKLGKQARLYGMDKDPAAIVHATATLQQFGQFKKVLHASFGDLSVERSRLHEKGFDGILLDLGISSRQIDDPQRGFSYQHDGPLDMRFDPSVGDSAADLVNSLDEGKLTAIISDFGEERMARRIAKALVRERRKHMILTTRQLATVVRQTIHPPHQTKSLARVFQALRIAVNDELGQLARVLPAAVRTLNVGGRLVVISYHSLEDRTVKQFFRAASSSACNCDRDIGVCDCGRLPQLRLLTKKPVTPEPAEVRNNPRARSAKLRAAEKV